MDEERVVPVLEGVTWEPNGPSAVLVQNDRAVACLALDPHRHDPDERTVVLVWQGCSFVAMGDPNDEGRHAHRLYGAGLDGLLWAGEVVNSSWIHERPTRGQPSLRHFVVPTKEALVEVMAATVGVVRTVGPTAEAALRTLACES